MALIGGLRFRWILLGKEIQKVQTWHFTSSSRNDTPKPFCLPCFSRTEQVFRSRIQVGGLMVVGKIPISLTEWVKTSSLMGSDGSAMKTRMPTCCPTRSGRTDAASETGALSFLCYHFSEPVEFDPTGLGLVRRLEAQSRKRKIL